MSSAPSTTRVRANGNGATAPSPAPAPAPVVPADTERECARLKERLALIASRLPQIAARLREIGIDERRPEAIELRHEASDLQSQRAVCERKLRSIVTPDPKIAMQQQRRQQQIDRAVREATATIEATVSRFEAQGDFRNARIWRGELLTLRERIEREIA